ncbi:MAG: hypothetical protein ABF969_12060 [Sporolactobacillus sp.]
MISFGLDEFMNDAGIDLELIRNGKSIAKFKGMKDTDQNGNYFILYPRTNFEIGDIFNNLAVNVSYEIIDKDVMPFDGQIAGLKAYFQTASEKKRQSATSSNVTFNVQSAVNSVIGQNNLTTFNIEQGFKELLNQIDKQDTEDKEQLKKLVELVRQFVENDIAPQKGMLSKFGDLIAKHAWITGPLGSLIVSWLAGK